MQSSQHSYAWPIVVGAIGLSLASNIVAIIASRRLLARNRTAVAQVRWSSLMMYLNGEGEAHPRGSAAPHCVAIRAVLFAGFVFNTICLIQCSINAASQRVVEYDHACLAQGIYSTFFMLVYAYTLALIAFTGYRAVTANASISPTAMLWFHIAAWAWAAVQTGVLTSSPDSVLPLPSGVSCFAVLANVRAGIVFFGLGVLPVMAALVFMYVAMYVHVRARTAELQRSVSVAEAAADPVRKPATAFSLASTRVTLAPDHRPPSPNASFMFGSGMYRTVTPQPRPRVASEASGVHDRHVEVTATHRAGGTTATADMLQLSVRSMPGAVEAAVSDLPENSPPAHTPVAVPASARHSTVHPSATATTAEDAIGGVDDSSTIPGSGIAMEMGRRTRASVVGHRRLSAGSMPPTSPAPLRMDPEPLHSRAAVGARSARVLVATESAHLPRGLSVSENTSARQVGRGVSSGMHTVDITGVGVSRRGVLSGAQLAMSIAQGDDAVHSARTRQASHDMGPDLATQHARYAVAERMHQRNTVTRIAHRHWVIATRVLALFAAYVLCWSPIFVLTLYVSTGHDAYPIMGVMAAALAHLLTFTNAVLHMMFNSALRHELVDILYDMRTAVMAGDIVGCLRSLVESQKGVHHARAATVSPAPTQPVPEEGEMLT